MTLSYWFSDFGLLYDRGGQVNRVRCHVWPGPGVSRPVFIPKWVTTLTGFVFRGRQKVWDSSPPNRFSFPILILSLPVTQSHLFSQRGRLEVFFRKHLCVFLETGSAVYLYSSLFPRPLYLYLCIFTYTSVPSDSWTDVEGSL